MQLKLSRYLNELRKNTIKFERIDINGQEDKHIISRNFRRIACFVVAVITTVLLKKGFSIDFVSYTSTVLSILIGLFISAIIFSFDKFYQPKTKFSKKMKLSIDKDAEEFKEKEYLVSIEDTSESNSKEKLWDTQSFNYAKQFAYLTGYSIVLSIFSIVFLSFSTMFKTRMSITIWDYSLDVKDISLHTITNFANVGFVITQRFFVIYWICGIIYYTLFIVSSMVNFMTVKMNRENDTN